jgi:hypothetical protein
MVSKNKIIDVEIERDGTQQTTDIPVARLATRTLFCGLCEGRMIWNSIIKESVWASE